MEKIITIFGSANTNRNESLYSETEKIGKMLAENKFTVCCGGYGGTMEAVSKGAKSANGKTIGITIDFPGSKPNDFIDENVVMPNWVERLMELIAIGDAYVILRGGSGTLTEISAILEMMNKKIMKEKQLVFYTDFWEKVIEVLKQDSEQLNRIIERNIHFVKMPSEITKTLISFKI
jgi:uncharacterized protein (TIGR00730 family)